MENGLDVLLQCILFTILSGAPMTLLDKETCDQLFLTAQTAMSFWLHWSHFCPLLTCPLFLLVCVGVFYFLSPYSLTRCRTYWCTWFYWWERSLNANNTYLVNESISLLSASICWKSTVIFYYIFLPGSIEQIIFLAFSLSFSFKITFFYAVKVNLAYILKCSFEHPADLA